MKLPAILILALVAILAGCENKAATLDRANCLRLRSGDSLEHVLVVMGQPLRQYPPKRPGDLLFLAYNTPNLEGTPFSGDGPVGIDLEDNGKGYVVKYLNCDAVW